MFLTAMRRTSMAKGKDKRKESKTPPSKKPKEKRKEKKEVGNVGEK